MGSKRVVLKPCELLVSKYKSYSSIYAGLWTIESSNMETHLEFCNFMMKRKIFGFNNTGVVAIQGKPYTFDDGFDSLNWLQNLFRALHDISAKGITVVIELDRNLNLGYMVSDLSVDKCFGKTISSKLIDTYFNSLIYFASYMKMSSFVKTRVKKFDCYKYKLNDSKIIVDFNY